MSVKSISFKKCVIFTHNIDIGKEQLDIIKNEKGCDGIELLPNERCGNKYCYGYAFSDGEYWVIEVPDINHRTLIWYKCYVDLKTVTQEEFDNIVLRGAARTHKNFAEARKNITFFNLTTKEWFEWQM